MSDPNTAEMQFCRKRTSRQDRAAKKLKIIVVSRIYSDALLTKGPLLDVLFCEKENILITRGHWPRCSDLGVRSGIAGYQ